MEKSADAFRTISEVAELLGTPAHVLRFWESRFPQVRPVKRAGGRRYYRPTDVALLSGIKRLLHSDGLTIRGVQKVLREHGIRHVMALADASVEAAVAPAPAAPPVETPAPRPPADVLILDTPRAAPAAVTPETDLPLFADGAVTAAEAPVADAVPEDIGGPTVWWPTLLRALPPDMAEQNRAALAEVARRLARLRERMQAGAAGQAR